MPFEPPAFREEPTLRAPRQTQLLRSDFAGPGFTLGCPGCDAICRKSNEAARHSDACRQRMEPVLRQSDAGRLRIRRAHERVAQYMDDLAQQPTGLVHDDLGQAPAKRRGGIVPGSSSPVSFENSAADATAPAAPVRASSNSTNPTLPPDSGSGMTDVDAPPHRAALSDAQVALPPAPRSGISVDHDATPSSGSGIKRTAEQNATRYNDEAEEGAGNSSSSAAPPPAPPAAAGPNRKRSAEVSIEDLDDGMTGEAGLIDIMSMHVG